MCTEPVVCNCERLLSTFVLPLDETISCRLPQCLLITGQHNSFANRLPPAFLDFTLVFDNCCFLGYHLVGNFLTEIGVIEEGKISNSPRFTEKTGYEKVKIVSP